MRLALIKFRGNRGGIVKEKIYLSTIDENAAALAKEYGLGIEIAEFCTAWNLDEKRDEIEPTIQEYLKSSDRFVLHGPFNELFPCAIDKKIRAVAAERYKQTIEAAQSYGVKKLVIHGGYNPRIYYKEWYTPESIVFWQEFVNEIPEDMVICLENVFEEEIEMLADIVRAVDDKRIRMCLDIGHVNAYSNVSVENWIRKCYHIMEHFHIHNNNGDCDSHQQLFDGIIPVREVLELINEKCPTASISLELVDAEPSVKWLLNNEEIK